jgi:hypothetical protein
MGLIATSTHGGISIRQSDSCEDSEMSPVRTVTYGALTEAGEATLFRLANASGMAAEVIEYGAILVALFAPDPVMIITTRWCTGSRQTDPSRHSGRAHRTRERNGGPARWKGFVRTQLRVRAPIVSLA